MSTSELVRQPAQQKSPTLCGKKSEKSVIFTFINTNRPPDTSLSTTHPESRMGPGPQSGPRYHSTDTLEPFHRVSVTLGQ